MSLNLPLSLLQHQGPMLKTLGNIVLSSLLPGKKPKHNPDVIEDVEVILPAPDPELVSLYRRWCTHSIRTENGNLPFEPDNVLPPHLFSQFALSVCAKQLKLTKYRLLNILNQGVGLEVHKPIPMGEPLHIVCKMVEIKEEDNRARLHQELHIGTAAEPHCYTAAFHTVFILGKRAKTNKTQSAKQNSPLNDDSNNAFNRIGKWMVAPNDGLNFALLTGDFNPIHWVGFLAKLSPFKRKVLHGFGMFTRTIETLQASAGKPVKRIHVRFINPAFLNGQLVTVRMTSTASDGEMETLELKDQNGKVLMIGDVGF